MNKAKCEICGSKNMLQLHHKFSQTKLNRKLYPEYIDFKKNIQVLCADCHLSKRDGTMIWDELEFCKELRITPRSKTGLEIYKRQFE